MTNEFQLDIYQSEVTSKGKRNFNGQNIVVSENGSKT